MDRPSHIFRLNKASGQLVCTEVHDKVIFGSAESRRVPKGRFDFELVPNPDHHPLIEVYEGVPYWYGTPS